MWDSRLVACAPAYRSCVLSWVDPSGDPASVRVGAVLDEAAGVARLPSLAPYAAGWRGPACLLFHHHDEHLEGLHQLVLKGDLVELDGEVVFRVGEFVTANGRPGTDAMPHASAPLHMLAFYRLGRRKAKAYLAKRGSPWPPIPFDEIRRRVEAAED